MDEAMREEACAAGWQMPAHGTAWILVILLGVLLAVDPVMRDMTENFLRAPIIPKAKTEGEAAVGSKQEKRVLKADKTAMTNEKELVLINPFSDDEAASDQLPAEAAVSDMVLNLPHMSEESGEFLTEWTAETIPEISSGGQTITVPMVPESVKQDNTAVGTVPDALIKTDITAAENSADDTEYMEVTVPRPDKAVPGNPSEDTVKTEVAVPENPEEDTVRTEVAVPENPEEDTVKTEVAVPENPSEDTVKTEVAVPENPEEDTANTEMTVPKEDLTVSGNIEDDSMASEAIVPDSSGTDTVIPEFPSADPSVSEPVVPDIGTDGSDMPDIGTDGPDMPDIGTDVSDVSGTGTDGSDVPAGIPSEIVGDNGGGEETVSCFLLDEAGMLYGFLPEYAEIPEGCLALPAECTGIRSGAFLGCDAEIVEIYIPAGASVIEEGAFAGLDFLEWIEADSGNPGCVSDSGVLFDRTMSVLLAFPGAWMEGYAVPGSVTRIAHRAFENTSITMLDVRACGILSFGDNVFGNSAGSGIEILVPEADHQVYKEMLSGYAVILN